MKKKLIYILISAGILSSCGKEFTDLNPISQRNVNAFYKTSDDMVIAVNAAYKALQMNGAYNQSYWILNEMRSDNTDGGADNTGLGADLNAIDNFNENAATAELITSSYLDSYVGISRCNIVLSRIEEVPMDQNLKNRVKGEALFLRSLFYYNLAVNFGRIPLVLKEITVEEGKSYPQLPASEVYKQLVADLATAEGFLDVKYTGNNVGRATKGAAATLMGKIYLTMGDKASAVAPLRRVKTYGYSLVPTYDKLWGIANKNNVESIFEVQYKGGGTNTGNAFTNAFSPLMIQSTGAYKNRPTAEMQAAYEPNDKRFAISMNPINGPLNAGRFILKYGTTTAYNEGDADYNFVVLRYADALLMLAEALGEGTEAYDLIYEVRFRAGLNRIDSSTPGTFAEKLLKERRVELAFENHRWPDLLRFGKAAEVMKAQGKTPRLLFLIPQRELDINNTYTQNPI
ncbi:RagB/SusD family nutrient uptake outer membrane protein [Pedobacter gandavensis]|uniref:RagB/SusD family nutrient uptake outer membrane protein n=1 Tax=Pedobacter gandavensis TaxID=2679963 RepID=UPI002478FD3A|nr:RagB/SusD family nutrient uptake outer membrane protein [Pedobacter gandavensis]WGQ11322.1 RagB/SusD family nutrient uptake outer membrane protein [Pedobacter gandavensis]